MRKTTPTWKKEGIQAFVKYNTFQQETKPRRKPNPFAAEYMLYDKVQVIFTCPNGQPLRYKATHHLRSDIGFESERRVYQCED